MMKDLLKTAITKNEVHNLGRAFTAPLPPPPPPPAYVFFTGRIFSPANPSLNEVPRDAESKVPSADTPELGKVPSFQPRTGQNIALFASPKVRNSATLHLAPRNVWAYVTESVTTGA